MHFSREHDLHGGNIKANFELQFEISNWRA